MFTTPIPPPHNPIHQAYFDNLMVKCSKTMLMEYLNTWMKHTYIYKHYMNKRQNIDKTKKIQQQELW